MDGAVCPLAAWETVTRTTITPMLATLHGMPGLRDPTRCTRRCRRKVRPQILGYMNPSIEVRDHHPGRRSWRRGMIDPVRRIRCIRMLPSGLRTATRCSRCRLDYARGGGSSGAEVCERGTIVGADTTTAGTLGVVRATALATGMALGAQAVIVTHCAG